MVPLDGFEHILRILGFAIGAVCSLWLLGLPIALVLVRLSLPTGKCISVSRPFLVLGVGIGLPRYVLLFSFGF